MNAILLRIMTYFREMSNLHFILMSVKLTSFFSLKALPHYFFVFYFYFPPNATAGNAVYHTSSEQNFFHLKQKLSKQNPYSICVKDAQKMRNHVNHYIRKETLSQLKIYKDLQFRV